MKSGKRGRSRADKHVKFSRIITVLELLKRRFSRTEIIEMLMHRFGIGSSMAYRYYQQAVTIGMEQFGQGEMQGLFLEHVSSLRLSIEQARKNKHFNALAQLQTHFSELMRFTGRGGDGQPININLTQSQGQLAAPQGMDSSLASELNRMTHDQLTDRFANMLGGAGRALPAPGADGDGGGSSEDMAGDDESPEHAGGPAGLKVVPLLAERVRRPGGNDRTSNRNSKRKN